MSTFERLTEADAIARLRARDATLFSDDAAVQALVANRLGWVDSASISSDVMPEIRAVVESVLSGGVTDVVLLGMGGSSLAPLVMGSVLGASLTRLHVLDTVSPTTVAACLEAIDPARTCYVVASKSGGTIEPNALYSIFRAHADEALGCEAAGAHFIAITDPGSSLQTLAAETGFGATLPGEPTVGGRFSALTAFGLLPAALVGADVDALLASAKRMQAACADRDPEANPAARLAAFIVESGDAGRDKLTIVSSLPLATFGLWVEQLVAESLGKNGRGVVPVVELSEGVPSGYGADRAVVVVRFSGDEALAAWAADSSLPVHEVVLEHPADLGAEFVRWEHAIALSGLLMGVNPFDEPNVAEAKAATNAVLDGASPAIEIDAHPEGAEVSFASGLAVPDHADNSLVNVITHAMTELRRGDYLAVLAYLPDDPQVLAPLTMAIPRVAENIAAAVCLELGPRYLHSTGQLHKGGPDNAVFIMVTSRDTCDLEVPGRQWSLRELHRAQAQGDLATLAAHGRRVVRIDLEDASHDSVSRLARAFMAAASVPLD